MVRDRLPRRDLDQQSLLFYSVDWQYSARIRCNILVRTSPACGRDSVTPGRRWRGAGADDPHVRVYTERPEGRCRAAGPGQAVSVSRRGGLVREQGRRDQIGGLADHSIRHGTVSGRLADTEIRTDGSG